MPLKNNLSLEISYFETYPTELQNLIIEYITQLDLIEQKAFKIAQDHLKSSFNIVKSNGFNDWLKTKNG